MNPILRNVSLACFLALAGASQAITLTDDFSVDQTGLVLTQTGSATSTGVSLGSGLSRFLINTQLENLFPGITSSSVFVSGGAFSFNNDPVVRSEYAIDYAYSTAVDFTGTTGFQIDFRTNDLPYGLFVVLTDSAGQESSFSGNVRSGASPFSVFVGGLSGSADLGSIVRVSVQSDSALAATDSSIVRVQSVSSVPSVPGPLAALPFGLIALNRRRRKA